jgi:hypothetical protein
MEFTGDIQDIEVRYTCRACLEDFTNTFTPGKAIPEQVVHEECPEDPSWQTSK